MEVTAFVASIVIECAEAEMKQYGETDVQKFLAQQARTCRDMIARKPVRKWRLLKLQSFCERLAKDTLARSYNMQPPCVVTELPTFP